MAAGWSQGLGQESSLAILFQLQSVDARRIVLRTPQVEILTFQRIPATREELERQWDAAEDAQDRVFYPRFPRRRTGPQLDELEAQVQRSYVWTGVHSIRLIRHDGHDHQDPDSDEFTVQFVRRGEHGDEVIQAPRRLAGSYSFRLSRASRDELGMELTTRLGMRHRVIRRLGFRHRTRYWMGGARPGDPPLEHPNGEEWSVPRA